MDKKALCAYLLNFQNVTHTHVCTYSQVYKHKGLEIFALCCLGLQHGNFEANMRRFTLICKSFTAGHKDENDC